MVRHRVIVEAPRRWPAVVAIVLGLVVVAGIAVAAWGYFGYPGAERFMTPSAELQYLRGERRELERQLTEAQKELESLRAGGGPLFDAQNCEIDVQACKVLRDSVSELQREVAGQREELAFYRNIVSPDQGQAGVRVLRMKLSPGEPAGNWRYEMVLVQPVRRDRTAEGSYDIQIEGSEGVSNRSLTFPELSAAAATGARFSFRTFQEIEGNLMLPEKFQPSRMRVTLMVDNGRNKPIEVAETFDWSRLVPAQRQ